MRKLPLFLALQFLAMAFLQAQADYYMAGDQKVELYKNVRSVHIYTKDSALAEELFRADALEAITIEPRLIPSDHFFLGFPSDLEVTPLEEELGSLLNDSKNLLHANYSLKTKDGMELWLSKNIVFSPNQYFSELLLEGILADYPGAYIISSSEGLKLIRLSDPAQSLKISQDLAATEMFHWVHPDFYARMEPMNDPLYSDQFYLNNTGQLIDGVAGTSNIDINAPEAWALLSTNYQPIVAVVDNGVEAHLDLQDTLGNSRLMSGYSAYNLTVSGNPYLAVEMHGQACAGIIGALHDNNTGIRGLAQDARILPIYFPLVVTPTNVVEVSNAILWAYRNGAEVMNNAYGYPSCLNNPFPVLTDAIDSALTHGRGGLGTVMVFAAGNDTGCVRFPGNLASTLTAGAIDKNGNHSNYANTGPEIDVVAPSASTANDLGVRVTDRMGANGLNYVGAVDISDINFSRQFGGTSSATSQVTGVVALMIKEDPNMLADTIMEIVKRTAIDMGVTGFDTIFGHGRINAYAAVSAVQDTILPVLWLNFETENLGNKVLLTWEAVQQDGSHFELWRNDRFYQELNIHKEKEYSFIDDKPLLGSSSYQIFWVGIDGTRTASSKLEIYRENNFRIDIASRNDMLSLRGKGIENGLLKLEMRDLSGKLSGIYEFQVRNGSFQENFAVNEVPSGLYILQFTDSKGSRISRKWLH
ncbi:MAG: S8 family peptidase [Bacteroidia bacterium]|nr:S8 family peptidase [Bacteroidia bacterium]